jgi:hypothetical protein
MLLTRDPVWTPKALTRDSLGHLQRAFHSWYSIEVGLWQISNAARSVAATKAKKTRSLIQIKRWYRREEQGPTTAI